MNKLKKFSNQELLTEIEQRIPDFTPANFRELFKSLGRQRQSLETIFQVISPEFYEWYQKVTQEVIQLKEKNNWKVKQI